MNIRFLMTQLFRMAVGNHAVMFTTKRSMLLENAWFFHFHLFTSKMVESPFPRRFVGESPIICVSWSRWWVGPDMGSTIALPKKMLWSSVLHTFLYMALFQSCVWNMGEDVLSQEAEPAGRWKRPEVGALLSIMAVGENMGSTWEKHHDF